MFPRPTFLRATALTMSLAALAACGGARVGDLDWDLRGGNALDTTVAARQATADRPAPDGRGVLSYPTYQVALARRGDTVAAVAARVGLDGGELARYNALNPDDPLRDGEVLALPRRVAAAPAGAPAPASGAGVAPVDVTAIATTALDRAGSGTAAPAPAPAAPAAPAGPEPTRHKVARGETAYSIARAYNVSAKALADWNGLGPDLNVREGQYLMIPTAAPGAAAPGAERITPPGAGSPTPEPPSAAKPLPDEETAPAAAPAPGTPPSPDLGDTRTAASATRFALPADGSIIRTYQKGKNDGIDIGSPAGSPVRAAADGTVAAVTEDTEQTPIIVIRHADGLLTVYAGVDGIAVRKGDKVSRGQTIAKIKAGNPSFLHFEVRKGVDSLDPEPYLR